MGNNINNEHDVGYRHILSAKKVFVQMLRTFINAEWAQQVEESNVTLINKSFILPDFKEKEADLVYQTKIKEREIIFYVLLELQSTVDYRMPYRLLLYMVDIWREYMKNHKANEAKNKNFRLPVIVPIVLYNGKPKWTAPLDFTGMLSHPELFANNVLQFRYFLLDVQNMEDEKLLNISNLVSSVFYLDIETEDLREMIKRLIRLSDTINNLSVEERKLFFTWLKNIFVNRFPEQERSEVGKIIDQIYSKEDKNMTSHSLGESIEKIINKQRKEGIEKVACNMIKKGYSIESIMDVTGLSEEEINEIQKKNDK